MLKKFLLSLAILSFASAVYAADLANGKKISRSCALCHGLFGQGTPGPASPRLAGMPFGYLVKELEHYRDGSRINPRMVVISRLNALSESDIDDIATYYATIQLDDYGLAGIPRWPGNVAAGEEIYEEECKSCHKGNGLGKSRKGIPALALQYSQYLFRQIKMFQWRKRVHDDDPEDETFDDFTDRQLEDLLAYISTLAPQPTIPSMPKPGAGFPMRP